MKLACSGLSDSEEMPSAVQDFTLLDIVTYTDRRLLFRKALLEPFEATLMVTNLGSLWSTFGSLNNRN